MGEDFRRRPALELNVSEVKGQDRPLALLGELSALNPKAKTGFLKDESGQIELVFEEERQLDGFEERELVRVFGKPFLNDNETKFNVELIHSMAGLDLGLFRQVKDLEQRFGVRE
jgi:hypothetical protein